jgi:spore coat polysaccharide biosynthesis protein SpsF (cytidylyltransferase family)
MDGIVFIARLGSTRLPQKHLVSVLGKTFIEWLVERFAERFKDDIQENTLKLILLTSDEPVNREFENVFRFAPVEIFYGSVNNIPLRLLQCAKAMDLDNIVSIDGDDILCSPEAAREVLLSLRDTKERKWFKTVGKPLGMNVAGYKRSVLLSSEAKIGHGKLETGWGRVFESEQCIDIKMGDYELKNDFRFTLDYEQDARFFKAVIEGLGEEIVHASDEEIINFVLANDLTRINREINDEYWSNFTKQIKEEG